MHRGKVNLCLAFLFLVHVGARRQIIMSEKTSLRHQDRSWARSLGKWRRVAVRAGAQIGDDKLGLTAAGIAFYMLMSIFPGLAAVVSIWGLLADPQAFTEQLSALSGILPAEVYRTLQGQAREVASAGQGAISLALAVSLVIAFFSAARAVKAIMMALNIVYDEKEMRGFFKFNAHAFAMTVALAIGFITAIAAVAIVPIILNIVGLGGILGPLIGLVRWPILFIGAWAGIAALYKFAPSRPDSSMRWLSPGAGAAVTLWIIASILFSVYVQNFANYNETYGSIGAVVIILMWFWVSAFVFLIGAEVDSEYEKINLGKPSEKDSDARAADASR